MFGIGASDIWKLYETTRFNPNKGFQDAGKALGSILGFTYFGKYEGTSKD